MSPPDIERPPAGEAEGRQELHLGGGAEDTLTGGEGERQHPAPAFVPITGFAAVLKFAGVVGDHYTAEAVVGVVPIADAYGVRLLPVWLSCGRLATYDGDGAELVEVVEVGEADSALRDYRRWAAEVAAEARRAA